MILMLMTLLAPSPPGVAQQAANQAQPVPAQPELSSAVDYTEVIAILREDIISGMRKERVPGLAIILMDGERVVWREGLGEAEYRSDRAMTPELRIQGSDFTKVLTAIAVMRAVERGEIDLDRPVSDYADIAFETLRPGFAVPTVRQLLAHQSGLPMNHTAGMFGAAPSTHAKSWGAVQPLYLGQHSGRYYNYSNLGYIVLAEMLAQHHDQTWERVITREVLAPLAMGDVVAEVDDNKLVVPHEGRKDQPQWWPRDVAALGLTYTLDEVARVAQVVLNGGALGRHRVLEPGSVDLMLSPQQPAPPLDLDNRYGFAWQLTNTVNPGIQRIARVTLSGTHIRGGVLLAPADRLGVVIVANSDEAGEMLRDVAAQALNLMLEAKSGIPMPDDDDDPPEQLALPAQAEPDDMAPAYAGALGLMQFEGEPLHYRIHFYGRTFHANLRTDGWYRIRYRLMGFVPLSLGILNKLLVRPVIIEGRRALLLSYLGRYFLAGIVHQPEPIPDRWRARFGEYEILNPDRVIELAEIERVSLMEMDGFLVARWRLPSFFKLEMSIPLQILNDNDLVTAGIGTGLGLRARFSEFEGQAEVEASGYRFRRRD